MSGYILHPGAYTDLDEIWEFIAQDNLDAADRVRDEIYEAIRALGSAPTRLQAARSYLPAPAVPTVRNYLIAYAPDERPLLVVAVLHGRRSPRAMAAILRRREGPGPNIPKERA